MVFGLNFLRERYKGFEVGAKPLFFLFLFLEKVGSKLLYRRRVVKEERNSLRFGKDEVVGCGGEERKSWVWKDEYTCCGGDEVF